MMAKIAYPPAFRTCLVGASAFFAGCLASPATATPIPTTLDLNIVRPALPNEGYLHFREGGEDLTGWIDTRNPAFYDGKDGKSTTITNTTDARGIGYDRSDFQVRVQNVIATDKNNVSAAPNIQRDYNYANQAYRALGISVLSTGNIDAKYNTVSFPLSDAAAATIRASNGAAKPTVPNYYVKNFTDGSFGDTKSPEDGTTGILIADTARNDTFAHELGHFLLDANRFAGPNVHSSDAKDLMADGGPRTIPNADVKLAADPGGRTNTGPSQPGQQVGTIGGLSQFKQLVGVPPAAGAFNPATPQIDAIFGPQSDGTSYVQRADHGTTFGDRADFNFVEDNIQLEDAAARTGSNQLMVNHPGLDFLTWEINPAGVPAPLDEAALGHVTPDPHDLALNGFNGKFFRTVDVVSLIARYADMDVDPASGKWSPRESALDYLLQFSADGSTWVNGTAVNVFDQGWTDQSHAEDFLARWDSPVDARFIRIQAAVVSGVNDRNVQIDAIIASQTLVDTIPEPASILAFMAGGSGLVLFRRRRTLRPANDPGEV